MLEGSILVFYKHILQLKVYEWLWIMDWVALNSGLSGSEYLEYSTFSKITRFCKNIDTRRLRSKRQKYQKINGIKKQFDE